MNTAPAAPRFEVSVDASDETAFRAVLANVARAGVEVTTSAPLAPGAPCLLQVTSRNGLHAIDAEATVTRALSPTTALITPTRYGRLVSQTQASSDFQQLAIEGGSTAAVPVKVLPIAREPSPTEPSAREGSARSGVSNPGTGTSASNPGVNPGPPELEAFEALGNYQVLRHLGGGGMAEVYLARSLLGQGVDKLVALKTAREGFGPATPYGAMFLDEARVSATLQHPNLVQVFDFGEAMGRPYLAMEFVAGRDLSAVLKRLRARKLPAPPSVVVAVGIALCRALEYVHEKRDVDGRLLNLVHRDVGPANLMLTARAEVKLMDFGVAASERSAGATEGLMVGKLGYMPAEQLLGGDPRPEWDLYAAGVTLYQLATLFHPYQGNPLDYLPTPAMRLHRGAPVKLNPAIPPTLNGLLQGATQLEAEHRPQHARQFREALEAAQRETGPADLGAWMTSLFREELEQEETEAQSLVLEGRRRTARQVPAFLRPAVEPLAALRRKVVYSSGYRWLARRPWLARSLTAALLVAVLGGGGAGVLAHREREAQRAELQKADAHLLAGRLNGVGDQDALDALLALKQKWPGEPRVNARLALLAERFESLGSLALERGNLEEAGAHLEAALRAEPGRAVATERLRAVEERVKERSRAKVLQSP